MEGKELIIAPSLLSGDFSNVGEAVARIGQTSAQWIHFDVMDGVFVPPITFGSKMLKDCRSLSSLFFDVHLMVTQPLVQMKLMIDAGADAVTFHLEAYKLDQVESIITEIRSYQPKTKIGIALNPETSHQALIPFLDKIDLILVMSVHPGYGGQRFISDVLEKIVVLNALKKEKGFSFLISVDGGINLESARLAAQSGVDVIVSGSAFFQNPNPVCFVNQLKEVAFS